MNPSFGALLIASLQSGIVTERSISIKEQVISAFSTSDTNVHITRFPNTIIKSREWDWSCKALAFGPPCHMDDDFVVDETMDLCKYEVIDISQNRSFPIEYKSIPGGVAISRQTIGNIFNGTSGWWESTVKVSAISKSATADERSKYCSELPKPGIKSETVCMRSDMPSGWAGISAFYEPECNRGREEGYKLNAWTAVDLRSYAIGSVTEICVEFAVPSNWQEVLVFPSANCGPARRGTRSNLARRIKKMS